MTTCDLLHVHGQSMCRCLKEKHCMELIIANANDKKILEHMFNFWILNWACALCLKEGMCTMHIIPTNGFVPKTNTKMFYHVWLAKFSWFFFLFSFWLQVLDFSLKSNFPTTPLIFGTTWAHVIEDFIQWTFDKIWPIFPHREFPSLQFSSTNV
jgi:hypothetical protein